MRLGTMLLRRGGRSGAPERSAASYARLDSQACRSDVTEAGPGVPVRLMNAQERSVWRALVAGLLSVESAVLAHSWAVL